MQKIKQIIIGLALSIGFLGLAASPTASAINSLPEPGQTTAHCVNGKVLTFPTWYRGLAQDPKTCAVQITALNDVWKIALNLIDILLQSSGYIAGGFIIWGGFKYMKSQGNSQNIASAKSTIMNASIGLGIALSSVAIVNYVAGLL